MHLVSAQGNALISIKATCGAKILNFAPAETAEELRCAARLCEGRAG
jgi:hypothetical protein